MAEYYIRREGDDDASGPFDLDQLASLAELGKIDDTVFYYDMDTEEWRPITDSEEAMEAMNPTKEKLTLQPELKADAVESEETVAVDAEDVPEETASTESDPDEEPETPLPEEPVEAPEEEKPSGPKLKRKAKEEEEAKPKPIIVEEMLAQAEGRSSDGPGSRSPMQKRAVAAHTGMIAAMALLLLSALSMGLVEFELLKTANAPLIVQSPYIISAIIDLVLAVFLILQVTEIYPLVRFKAALGFGFISILFLASNDPMLSLGNALICASIYFATASTKLPVIFTTIAIGVVGAALYAQQLLPALTGG